jgi:hypothetical protein
MRNEEIEQDKNRKRDRESLPPTPDKVIPPPPPVTTVRVAPVKSEDMDVYEDPLIQVIIIKVNMHIYLF